ncbi:MAG: ABC transporter ATP-binding protein [Tepidisphaeraceae bacterium]
MGRAELTMGVPVPLADAAAMQTASDAGTSARRGKLEMTGINKRFGKSDVATITDIHFSCEPGEFVVVVGPSGCGKTTLLNIVAGMTRPDSGTVTLDGKPIHGPGPDRAMVFQDHGLFPWLTAAQNVEFGLKMAGVPAKQRRDQVQDALKMVRMHTHAAKLVHELSGGMKQRIAIARALVMDPAVLLMDEPFAALDAQTRTVMHQELQNIWYQTRKTIFFVTHSVGEAVRLADRIIVMHAHPGRIRKEIAVQLAHPRQFDSPDINALARQVRKEIEDEVTRLHTLESADSDLAEKPSPLGHFVDDLGGSI